jgi:hypothetical protein
VALTTRANKNRGCKPETRPVHRGAPIPRSRHVTRKRGKVKKSYQPERYFFEHASGLVECGIFAAKLGAAADFAPVDMKT